jgi:lysyl-tRNA synthetase class 2
MITPTGELTLSAQEIPQLLSPSLHVLPTGVTDKETLARLPQLDLLLHQRRRDLLRLRHVVEKSIASFLDDADFTKVTTPILAADTGGAAAQPFETTTNEIPDVPLRLRIAPEIALKKLTAADLGAVYEIGPCFRNEGLDATHNPEFSTCEFYKPYASLDVLMSMTEAMLAKMARACKTAMEKRLTSLHYHSQLSEYFDTPRRFTQLPFLPTLIQKIREHIPSYRLPQKLDASSASELSLLITQLQKQSPSLNLKVPSNSTTPRLLDYLCSRLIEPLCLSPTFITNHPAIMSPLAKSYTDPTTGHLISARAELFINSIEYANLYEEENSPFVQARNFLLQAGGSSSNELTNSFGLPLTHEEVKQRLTPGQQYYIRVLEMGLPPTGGWGCGIERLIMLFGGAGRIGEVLPFGGLRSVVAMGTRVDRRGGGLVSE